MNHYYKWDSPLGLAIGRPVKEGASVLWGLAPGGVVSISMDDSELMEISHEEYQKIYRMRELSLEKQGELSGSA